MFFSAEHGHVAAVDILLANKADIDCRTKTLLTPLMIACLSNHLKVVELLCSKGADVSIEDEYGNTALHFVVGNNSLKITKVLLRYGAELITNQVGLTPFEIAKKKKYAYIVAVLKMQGTLSHYFLYKLCTLNFCCIITVPKSSRNNCANKCYVDT